MNVKTAAECFSVHSIGKINEAGNPLSRLTHVRNRASGPRSK
jgi:hypothetical protein